MEKITAQEYFDTIKDKKIITTDEELQKYYDNADKLIQKAMITNQTEQAKKLLFHLETIEKERELIKMGINTFIYKDDIEEFIDNVAKNTVKIIELERYEREIPDEAAELINQTKDIFDKFYIIFTDYTGKVERKALEERAKEKDPILFGTFQDEDTRVLIDRFYFIADWEDEYCDLTLDKMVAQMKNSNKSIEHKISTPLTVNEIREQLNSLKKKNDNIYVINNTENKLEKSKGFFSKIKTFLTRGK